jgi:hypothetical protein
MRRHWQVRRQRLAAPDGARRWDRAYALILSWGLPAAQDAVGTGITSRATQEVSHENGGLRAGLDCAPSPSSDH